MLQASPSAPSPFCSTMPDATSPIDQLVRIRLTKKAATAKPSPQKLKPKKIIAMIVTGTRPISTRTTLITISASDQLGRPERRHHQVAEIARPHLFQERDREADLAAKENVPEQHRADEGAAGLREHARLARRDRAAGSPTSASAPPASRSGRRCAARNSAADTSSAAPSRRCARREGEVRYAATLIRAACLAAVARDVEEDLLHRLPPVAGDELGRRALVDDLARLHHQHVVAEPLHLRHVVRGEQDRRALAPGGSARGASAPSRRCRDRARRSARRAAARRAG